MWHEYSWCEVYKKKSVIVTRRIYYKWITHFIITLVSVKSSSGIWPEIKGICIGKVYNFLILKIRWRKTQKKYIIISLYLKVKYSKKSKMIVIWRELSWYFVWFSHPYFDLPKWHQNVLKLINSIRQNKVFKNLILKWGDITTCKCFILSPYKISLFIIFDKLFLLLQKNVYISNRFDTYFFCCSHMKNIVLCPQISNQILYKKHL